MTSRSYTISFPPPDRLLNMNDQRGQSRYAAIQRADVIAAWKFAAFLHARDAVNRKEIPEHLPYAIVAVDLPVRSLKTRRDAHNYYPTLKAILDGLVDAKVFEDDNVNFVATREPSFHAQRDNPNVTVWIWLQ